MWQPLLKLLSFIGNLRFPLLRLRLRVTAGNPELPDSEGGNRWKTFLDTEALWQVWGPPPGSPWDPYHCVTLFAALDLMKRGTPLCIGPLPDSDLPDWLKPSADLPSWARQPGTMLMLDAPGPRAVSAAFHLVTKGGYQPVCTFDNWPNSAGVLHPERILGTLLYYAAALADQRKQLASSALPLWICDHDRISLIRPAPGRYDNRYIIEDRLLPGPRMLRAAGIHSLVYIKAAGAQSLPPDLVPYLTELQKNGFHLQSCSLDTAAGFTGVEPLSPPPPSGCLTALSASMSNPQMEGLMRSSAGGFGGYVPQPSSG